MGGRHGADREYKRISAAGLTMCLVSPREVCSLFQLLTFFGFGSRRVAPLTSPDFDFSFSVFYFLVVGGHFRHARVDSYLLFD